MLFNCYHLNTFSRNNGHFGETLSSTPAVISPAPAALLSSQPGLKVTSIVASQVIWLGLRSRLCCLSSFAVAISPYQVLFVQMTAFFSAISIGSSSTLHGPANVVSASCGIFTTIICFCNSIECFLPRDTSLYLLKCPQKSM